MVDATTESKRIVNAYVDVWNERTYPSIPDVVSESFVMYDPAAPEGEVHGRDGLETFIRNVVTAFPDFEVSVGDMLSSDGLVMYDATITMTHEGAFGGIGPTGREVEIDEMSKFRVSNGKIREHRVYFDQQDVLEQLGVTSE
ncbi:ester cyclase [Haloplanus aerogenes]|uniref:Steroid delta-isomerase-like uncharacterized protein n=1 Tax=Haloplanus aerogenes TaxID=660522 RepID=A0A3M0CWD1_9EURY|nr:ester cyclase [Haloplanus aerogenes]AZH27001.1 hypothetical protein DU502_17180 [Haloplanus aerogenes]RMB13508.1 steroid delta-isomerase-like uncharacterized protein [Haloplanus aerogenes]